MSEEIEIRVKEKRVFVNIYTCPKCGKESEEKHDIIKCLNSHQSYKYNIGDVVKFFWYPGDSIEWENDVIIERKTNRSGKPCYVCEDHSLDIDEEDIDRVLMSHKDRLEQHKFMVETINYMSDYEGLNWYIEWNNEEARYQIIGIKS